ncbi:hypothetical protein ACFXOS_19830 [Streptomyces sp. NPDC059175]|uniref:hypothetical protein n=1 Tax=Streptomyces sp. NPDC059175 TaxID=3346757 RepID=UPI0036910F38
MTDNELLMLATGINLGVYLMVLQHFVGDFLDARKDRKVAAAALAELEARTAPERT